MALNIYWSKSADAKFDYNLFHQPLQNPVTFWA